MGRTDMLRAVVVGCGRIGCGFDDDPRRVEISSHAGAHNASDGYNLVGLADLDPQRLERYGDKFGVRGRYTDYTAMLQEEAPDVVSVCTTSESHLEVVRQAVASGARAIFCEKPIADSLASAREMVALCRDNDVMLFIDHQRRFDAAHQSLARFVADGRLGRVQHATCYYTAGVANTGTHLFDLLRLLLGQEPSWIEGRESRNSSRAHGDPNVDVSVCFGDETMVAVQACDVEAFTIFEVNLLGTSGRLSIRSHGYEISFEGATESTRYSGYRELTSAESPIADTGRRDYMMQAMAHIRTCLLGTTKPLSTGEDGYRALEMVVGALDASRSGRRVAFPLTDLSLLARSN